MLFRTGADANTCSSDRDVVPCCSLLCITMVLPSFPLTKQKACPFELDSFLNTMKFGVFTLAFGVVAITPAFAKEYGDPHGASGL
jgi:hypothetical protein